MCNPHVQPQASHPRLRCGAGVAIIPKRTVAWALSHSVDPAALAFLVPAPRVQRAAKAQNGTIRTNMNIFKTRIFCGGKTQLIFSKFFVFATK